jgi:hypothetical protein
MPYITSFHSRFADRACPINCHPTEPFQNAKIKVQNDRAKPKGFAFSVVILIFAL